MIRGAHTLPCSTRLGKLSDKPYIMDSWLKCHRGSPTHRQIPEEIYFSHQEAIIDGLLNQSLVIMACSPEDDDHLLGYCIAQPSRGGVCVIHWINVKLTYRKMGIGRMLLDEARARCNSRNDLPTVMTHISADYKWLKDKWDLVYSPYLISVEIEEYDPSQVAIN